MKIVFLGPAYPFRGGISAFAHELADKLSKNVQVFFCTFTEQYPAFLFPGKNQIDPETKTYPYEIEACFCPYKPWTWQNAVDYINRQQPDLLVASYALPFFAPCYHYILKRVRGKKAVILHNAEFHENWFLGNYLTQNALRSVSEIIVLSENGKTGAHRLFPRHKITVFPHPNYDCYIHETPSVSEKIYENLLFFGYIKPYKGLDILLNALPKVLVSKPELTLTIAGEIYGKDIYSPLIRKLGIEKNVFFHNCFIKDSEVKDYFLKADAVVLPYRSATQSGIVQLAFSFHKPVITSACPGIMEIVRNDHNGLVFPINDVNSLAASILELYTPGTLNRLTENIAINREKYSWQPLAAFLESLV